MSRIPKLIHQTWKSYDLPEKYITLVDSWKKMHPDWKYKLYDDQDCIEFIQKYYPELFDAYQSLEEPVMKADMFRYLIIYHFGGLYADLDTEALKSFDELLKDNSKMIIGVELEFDNTMLLKMAPVYNNFYKKNNLNKQYIQYCFLSEAKNPLLLEIAKEIARDKHKVFDSIKHANTIIKTGPGIFSKIVQKYINNGYPIKVLDIKYFSGVQSAIKHYLFGINNPSKESYIKHYEMSSWRGQNDLVYTLTSCLILGLLITIIVFFIYGIIYYFKCKKRGKKCLNKKIYCRIKKVLIIISIITLIIVLGILINFAVQDRVYLAFLK